MPLQPVQAHPAPHAAAHPAPKDKLTAASVFLSLVLAVCLVALMERAVYDVNRLWNPLYGECRPSRYLIITDTACQVERFAQQTVLYHSSVTLPVFAIFLVLAVYLKRHRRETWQAALYRVAGVVALTFGLQLLLEVTFYLFQYHRLIAWYFTFGVGAVATVWLVIHLERRQAMKRHGKHRGGTGADDEHE